MREENPKILNDFLNYLFVFRNYSKGTIREYNSDLLLFFYFLIKYLELSIKIRDINIFIIATIKESDIIAFLVYLNYVRNNSPETRNRKLAAIKAFFKYLYNKYSHLKDKLDPAKNIQNAEQMIKLPKYLYLKEAQKIQYIFNNTNTKNPTRNNTIITLFLNTGMRLSELANIDIKNIDFKAKTIKIIGKGNKERIIYLNKSSLNAINKYLDTRNYRLDEALFLNNKNKRLSIYGIEKICKKAFVLAGLEEKNYTVHSLRHTAATYVYKETKDILIVREFLGHSTIKSTEIYTHIENEELKKAVDRNPLNLK